MSVIRDVKNVKIKHGDDVVLVKSGNFYRCYDKDSYIISYIMNYQVKQATANNYMCGFPVKKLFGETRSGMVSGCPSDMEPSCLMSPEMTQSALFDWADARQVSRYSGSHVSSSSRNAQ